MAGEFNKLREIPQEMWDMMEKMIRSTNKKSKMWRKMQTELWNAMYSVMFVTFMLHYYCERWKMQMHTLIYLYFKYNLYTITCYNQILFKNILVIITCNNFSLQKNTTFSLFKTETRIDTKIQ